jgi:GNAT superfamily N-acetyltransferase
MVTAHIVMLARHNACRTSMDIQFSASRPVTAEQFIDVLKRSTLGERRPIDDRHCIESMLKHGNLLCTAWDCEQLVGVARSVTDFSYCCYLSDLAVDVSYQSRGIGTELIRLTQMQLGHRCTLILLAAPKAAHYYPKIGFRQHPSAWVLGSGDPVGRR